MKNLILITLLLISAGVVFGQEFGKLKRGFHMRDGIITDSASTIMIPVDGQRLSSGKLTDQNYFCVNLVFYDFVADNSFKLFNQETYIAYLRYYQNYSGRDKRNPGIVKNWILYCVKNVDSNKDGKIDSDDPDILYSSDIHGKNLKQLTTEQESVASIHVYHDQGFALLTMQRDSDKDGSYKTDDKEYFHIKLDLATLSLGKKIESK